MNLTKFMVWTLFMSAFLPLTINAQTGSEYILGSGDKVRVIVYGEDDLSGEYEVGGNGDITLPLIGQTRAGGSSLSSVESKITSAYAGDYLINPRVNVEVLNYRPVFIMGEVKSPGNYPYINGMTVLQAVSVAGGYTYRAKKQNIILRRTVNGLDKEMTVSETSKVFPGDIVHIDERFF